MSRKNSQNSSHSHDNTFNFNMELQLSQGKKERTGDNFFKENFQFDDFMNIGDDKTIKSTTTKNDRRKNTGNSDILRKDMDSKSNILNFSHNTDNEQRQTSKNNSTSNQFIIPQSLRKIDHQKSPKFGDQANNKSSEEFYGKYFDNQQLGSPKIYGVQYASKGFSQVNDLQMQSKMRQTVTFKKKNKELEVVDLMTEKQKQFKQLDNLISFYQNQVGKIRYESCIIQQFISQLAEQAQDQQYEIQSRQLQQAINMFNVQIQKQRAIQKKMSRVVCQLDQQYNELIESVNEMNFKRPTIIKDETKVLIDEINLLKSEFQNIQRDTGSLNLSSTLVHPFQGPTSFENRFDNRGDPTLGNQKKQIDSHLIDKLFEQVYQKSASSQDTQFLKNIKLSCLKDEWNLYTNREIQVNVDYKNCPLMRLRIGNKTSRQLKKFYLKIRGQTLMQGEIIQAKSFIIQQVQITPQIIEEILLKGQICYEIQGNSKNIDLFCPTGVLNFGQFNPLTKKQFQKQSELSLPILQSALKPLDKSIINCVSECLLYLPTLQLSKQEDEAFGMFISVRGQGCLVTLRQQVKMLKIIVKNSNCKLVSLLQFIFCE